MLQSAETQYQRQTAIAATTAAAVNKTWAKVGPFGDWASAVPAMTTIVDRGRSSAVATAVPYTPAVLAEQGINAPPAVALNPERFTATAPSGAPMSTVILSPIIGGLADIATGTRMENAFEQVGSALVGIVLTALADTRRNVYSVDMTSRPAVSGYVRQLNPPSCPRCIVLAGRFYRWNKGFLRHPRCDCQHVPTTKQAASRWWKPTDPAQYFDSLSAEQQDTLFGKSNARAIRDGADITRVVNVQQRGLTTAIGSSRRNRRYPTLTPDDIYRIAGTRTNAITLLQAQGYLR